MTNETIINEMKFTYKLNISTKKLNGMLNKARLEGEKSALEQKKKEVRELKKMFLDSKRYLAVIDEIFPDCTEKETPKMHKTNFKAGDSVKFLTTKGDLVSGKILKIYESTFGAKVRDTALQIKLDSPYLGRGTTTVRAKKCVSIKKSPFYGKKCKICNEPAVARIFSKNGTTINDYYCRTCYAATRVLLPLGKKDDFQIVG